MKAVHQGKTVYVHYVSRDKKIAIISYNEDRTKMFKVDSKDLEDPDEALKAELKKGIL